MAVAKNPGVGQGRGGGRPRGKVREVEEVRLRLSPEVAELIRVIAETEEVPIWRIVQMAILAREPGVRSTQPTLPQEAQEIAQEVTAFLEGQEDRPAAVKALRRAWAQALALATSNLKRHTHGTEHPSGD